MYMITIGRSGHYQALWHINQVNCQGSTNLTKADGTAQYGCHRHVCIAFILGLYPSVLIWNFILMLALLRCSFSV
uniref:Uncharacterized protein n=1 Tax=Arion vulgaris TaxID=1028688 RepID=A0A0B6Y866_9EUPU